MTLEEFIATPPESYGVDNVNLLYSRYKNPNLNVVEGNQQDCYFKFVELS